MTLTDNCYHGMFEYCTSLEIATRLPAVTLAEGCYIYMFDGCSSLKIKEKDEETGEENFIFRCPPGSGLVSNMFNNISEESEFQGGTPAENKYYYWV